MQKAPVLFLMFNRPEVTARAFECIRQYRPTRLYLAADGPRPTKKCEAELCEQTRNAVETMIDWDCDVRRLYRTENLGCAKGVSSAIDWFFAQEEWGAIIEDDVMVAQDFFTICEELLPLYKNNPQIMMITSQFLGNEKQSKADTYGFSNNAYIWGWATWRRAWNKMDMTMSAWPGTSFFNLYKQFGLIRSLIYRFYYWNKAYHLISTGQVFNSWATRWAFTVFANSGLSLTPYANLSANIGCSGAEGAHYNADDEDLYSHLTIHNLPQTLKHPNKIELSKDISRIEERDFLRIRIKGFLKLLKKKIKI